MGNSPSQATPPLLDAATLNHGGTPVRDEDVLSVVLSNHFAERTSPLYGVLMGTSASGKSSFIKRMFAVDVPVKDHAGPCTTEPRMYNHENRKLFFVDTPGFSDPSKSDAEIVAMTKQYLTTEHIHPSCFFLFRQFIREWNSTERAVGELVTRLASEYDAKITVILTYGCSIPPTLSSDIAELRGLSNKEAQNTRRYISWKKVLTENLEETIPGAPVVIIDNDPLNPEQPLPDGTNWIPTLLEVLSNTKESEWLVAVSLSHDPAVKHAIWAAVVGLASGAAVSGATIRLGDACIKQVRAKGLGAGFLTFVIVSGILYVLSKQ